MGGPPRLRRIPHLRYGVPFENSPSAPKVAQAALRRDVWRRAQSRCEKCSSTYALEINHIIPRAKGGGDHKDNLRLLCRFCNQREAIEHFGIQKMDRYRSPQSEWML